MSSWVWFVALSNTCSNATSCTSRSDSGNESYQRERCYSKKWKIVFADNRIAVSLRICRMVFVGRYPGLQGYSSFHHHVNDTFWVGNAVCSRPRLVIFNILSLVGKSPMQTEYLPSTFMLFLTRNVSYKCCIAARWWSKADDPLVIPPPPNLWRTEGKVKTIIQVYISAISLVYHDLFLCYLVRSFGGVICG